VANEVCIFLVVFRVGFECVSWRSRQWMIFARNNARTGTRRCRSYSALEVDDKVVAVVSTHR
jgi:hypothetical protein